MIELIDLVEWDQLVVENDCRIDVGVARDFQLQNVLCVALINDGDERL